MPRLCISASQAVRLKVESSSMAYQGTEFLETFRQSLSYTENLIAKANGQLTCAECLAVASAQSMFIILASTQSTLNSKTL